MVLAQLMTNEWNEILLKFAAVVFSSLIAGLNHMIRLSIPVKLSALQSPKAHLPAYPLHIYKFLFSEIEPVVIQTIWIVQIKLFFVKK